MAGKSDSVRTHIFDSFLEYLQGIRDGAKGSGRDRDVKFTDRQRRDSRADGRRSRQRLGPHWAPESRRFQRRGWINSHSGQASILLNAMNAATDSTASMEA